MNKFFILITVGFFVLNFGLLYNLKKDYINTNNDFVGASLIPGFSNEEAVKGIKEALTIGAKNSVFSASKTDGFYGNSLIKIPFPKEVIEVKNFAEKAGMKKQCNAFEKALNRSAEAASREAADILINSITKMTVKDGIKIVTGADNSATEYLKANATLELKQKFAPIVKASSEKVLLTAAWEPLMKSYNKTTRITGKKKVNPDLNAYVTDKAIDGLFKLIAQEEYKIRKDPKAQISSILKLIFGGGL